MGFKNYVKAYLEEDENSLETLKADFGIDTRVTDNGLVIFSYSQIDSPKTNPIVRMCRGLVLEKDTWEIINYPFYRFYNFEEVPEENVKFNWKNAVATTKIDGSLLCVWYYKGKWNISTRSCIGGENQINDFGTTFNDLFDEAIKPFTREDFFLTLKPELCYIFELVSPLNQIVTPYAETKLYCIGARVIDSYNYREINFKEVYSMHENEWKGVILKPEIVPLCNDDGSFKGFDEMKALAESVGSKDEGFVVVDFSSIDRETGSFPRVKVKNSAYVALHHLKGTIDNGSMNFGEILYVVYKNEQDEIISSLPQYKKYFDDVNAKLNQFLKEFNEVENSECFQRFLKMSEDEKKDPQNKKDFAMTVMNGPYKKFSTFLFLYFNKGYKSLNECLENSNKNIKDVLKDLWDKYLVKY